MTDIEEKILKYIVKNKVQGVSLNTLRVLYEKEGSSLFDVSISRLKDKNVIQTEINGVHTWDIVVIMPFRNIKKLLEPIKFLEEKK